jgi:quaternary ammonium compound-resistance protein SugE
VGFAVAWVTRVIAGLLEVVWAYAMKQSDGFTRAAWPSAITISAMLGGVALLAFAMRAIPLSTPIRSGLASARSAPLIGVTILGEQATASRIMAATLIIGLVMMKVSSDP